LLTPLAGLSAAYIHPHPDLTTLMSDSLRDQLLQAGFKKSREEPVKKKQRPSAHTSKKKTAPQALSNAQERNAAVEKRKIIKAQIKAIIEADAVKEFAGEIAYRYTLQNRIRELHVADPIRQQLVAGTLVITRLNGDTYVVPDNTATQIRTLNPGWAIVKPNEASTDTPEGYEDFSVPDDLVW